MGVTTTLKDYLYSDEFRDALIRRYHRFEILSEAGLRTSVANLLIAKLQALGDPAKDYSVACEPHLAETNVVPDVLIWKKQHPRIWIELKDTRHFEQKKATDDWQKMRNYCYQFESVKAGYLIYVARYDDRDIHITRDRESLRLRLVKIALKPHIPDFEVWNNGYRDRAHYRPPESTRRVGRPTSRF